MKIFNVNHVQLNTDDVETSRAFYEKAFDAKVITRIMQKDGSAIKGYMVEIVPGSVIEIQPPRFPMTGKSSAWNTIAIETDDIEAACARVEAAGGIREVGPMQSDMGGTAILNAVVIGPSGEHIELLQLI